MGKPAYKIQEDYEEFDQYILTLVRSNWKDVWTSDLGLERRFSNLEKGQEQLLVMVQNLDTNLRLYREDSKHFMEKTEQANEKFRIQMKEEFEKFRLETDDKFEKIDQRFEKVDQRFEKIDQRFEKIDQRFEAINQQFIDVHKAINRMTVFFITGLGVIVLLAKLLDKLWS